MLGETLQSTLACRDEELDPEEEPHWVSRMAAGPQTSSFCPALCPAHQEDLHGFLEFNETLLLCIKETAKRSVKKSLQRTPALQFIVLRWKNYP